MKFINGQEIKGVLCVWEGCLVDLDQYEDFKEFLEGESSTPISVNCLSQFESNMVNPNGSNRQDFFFEIDGDLAGIVIPRLSIGFRWFEDVVNDNPDLAYFANEELVPASQMFDGYEESEI